MSKRTVIIAMGSGADVPAVKGSSIAIGAYYPHEDGTTWIHATPERYYVRGNTPPEVELTVGQYYWFKPIDPKGDASLILIPAGVGDLYYSDLVENNAVDPSSMDPMASPSPAWAAAMAEAIVDASVVGDNLIVEHMDGTTDNLGNVRGPASTVPGPAGAPGGSDSSFASFVAGPSLTATALDAKIAAAATLQGPGARALASKCAMGLNAAVGIAGDSTADKPYEYLTMGLTSFVGQYPLQSADYYEDNGSGVYGTVMPVTTGISARTAAFRDEFNRTAADLVGSPPDLGANWFATGNGAGDWSLDGSGCAATADATVGFVYTTVTAGDGELNTRVTVPPGSAPRFVIKRVNDSNYLRVDVDHNVSGQYRLLLVKFIAGVQTTVAQSAYFVNSPSGGNVFDVSVRVVGTRLTALINGQPVGGTLAGGDVTALATGTTLGLSGTNRTGVVVDRMQWDLVTAATSPGVVTIYNGSKGGSDLTYQEGVISTLYPSGTPLDTLIINSGHNYGSTTPSAYTTAIDHFIGVLRTVQPTCGIVIASQNPRVSPAVYVAEHAARIAALPAYAAGKGYGYIPSYETFGTLASITSAEMQSDGVHPTGGLEGGSGIQSVAVVTYLNSLAGVGDATKADVTALEEEAVDRDAAISAAIAAALSGLTQVANYRVYTTTGTTAWSKPTGLTYLDVILVAGGGGAGSGRRGAAGTARSGGSGAGGAGRTVLQIQASDLPSSMNVVVGTGGTGGAAVTTDDTNGNPGTAGAASSFQTTGGTIYAQARPGAQGLGGTNAVVAGGALGVGHQIGVVGGSSSITAAGGGAGTGAGPSGGGAGGGISTGDVEFAGGASFGPGDHPFANISSGAPAGTVPGGAGGTAADRVPAALAGAGLGGGGGGASKTTAGGAGGNAGKYGAGGGGGGASLNGFASGAGGNGAQGIVVLIEHF